MSHPRVFIASSRESLGYARAIQNNLEEDAQTNVWNQSVFEPSKTALDSLLKQVRQSDFGVFVFSADDVTLIRGNQRPTVRDNVVLELGMFIGHLGKERSLVVAPRECDLHLPTDLLGLTTAMFENRPNSTNLDALLGPPCNQIRNAIKSLGPVHTVDATQDDDRVDIFVSSPMYSLAKQSDKEYGRVRSETLAIICQLKEKFAFEQVYYAGEKYLNKSSFDPASISALKDLKKLREARKHLLVYPQELVTGALVETGFALALNTPSVYLVHNRNHLPYMLQAAAEAYQNVAIYEYSDLKRLKAIIDKHDDVFFPESIP